MTTMYDSTSPGAIPNNAVMVAGYVDGEYAWRPVDWARFKATEIGITVVGQAGAKVADVESGDLSPGAGTVWAAEEVRAGRRPTVYSDRSSWPGMLQVLARWGIAHLVDWWAADPTGTPHLVPGSVATQYWWGRPGTYDLSVTNGVWPGTLTVVEKPAMVAVMNRPGFTDQYWEVAADGGVFSFGGAPFYGSLGGQPISAPIVAAAPTSDGKGYRLVGSDGAVYDFGTAVYEGGTNK